ncbi:hypothetical protein TRIP_B350268 [uncultured Desulfatiglans sp.]|uniref:Uncharacterized protein n=1 Tax=Uncultured Desulfatiglans sp. TaxID=1748965 RepID=A0A653AAZ5_UNCDX|nr:hypothetical protein TRIP_B350268 [uncultured Desulfatiglans sp.]
MKPDQGADRIKSCRLEKLLPRKNVFRYDLIFPAPLQHPKNRQASQDKEGNSAMRLARHPMRQDSCCLKGDGKMETHGKATRAAPPN